MPRRRLWRAGGRYGVIAGIGSILLGVIFLAARWALDQRMSPAAEAFGPGFLTALQDFGQQMVGGAAAFLAAGGVVGGLVGLLVAEVIGITGERLSDEPGADPAASGADPPVPPDGP